MTRTPTTVVPGSHATGSPPRGHPGDLGGQVRAAQRATYAVFAGQGLAVSTWASRVPQVRGQLHLGPAGLGLLLATVAAGGAVALPLAGPLVTRVGARGAVAGLAVLLAAGLGLVSVGYLVGVALLAVGLFVLGFATSAWDVAMTVHGALVEQQLDRPVMSRFYAGFSVGTVAGALLGTAVVALHVPVPAHLAGTAVLVAVAVPAATRWFLPDPADAAPRSATPRTAPQAPPRHALVAWRETRTLLVGVLAPAFALAEGAGTGWISLSLIDDRHTSAVVGTLALVGFLAAMTTGRWVWPALLQRWGRVAVLQAGAGIAAAGVLLFSFGPGLAVALAGVLVWGVGASLGFPVAMSAGADHPARAVGRIGVIASICYVGFLCGPPLIGGLAARSSVPHALLAVPVALAGAALVAGATRRPPAGADGAQRRRVGPRPRPTTAHHLTAHQQRNPP